MLLLFAQSALSTLSGSTARPLACSNVKSIASKYDAFLLDQFGVMHDGQKPLPGAIECYEQLAAAGKKLVVLSNTSRRRSFAMKKLPKLGFDPDALTDFVTSGEAAYDRIHADFKGARMLWCSWADDFQAWDPTYLDGLDVQLADASTADFVLCQGSHVLDDGRSRDSTGVFESGAPNAALDEALRTCASRDLLMICANPDFTVTLPDGTRGFMPGKIAQYYEDVLGGRVDYYGKPHAAAFEAALEQLAAEGVTDRSRVCHVGDSLLHDVAGARAAGVDSLFVAGGIHAEEVGIEETGSSALESGYARAEDLSEERLAKVFAKYGGVHPTHSTPAFVWE